MRHQLIDIHVGPTIVEGKIICRSICPCGRTNIPDEVKIGQYFHCDVKSIRWVKFTCHGCGKVHTTRIIDVWGALLVPRWMLLELFDINAAIPTVLPEGMTWEKISDNKAAPPHRPAIVREVK